ncbi:hypothetical protein [Zymomonas sp.]|nr:hypothetical protein [Zymomonas sp.]
MRGYSLDWTRPVSKCLGLISRDSVTFTAKTAQSNISFGFTD